MGHLDADQAIACDGSVAPPPSASAAIPQATTAAGRRRWEGHRQPPTDLGTLAGRPRLPPPPRPHLHQRQGHEHQGEVVVPGPSARHLLMIEAQPPCSAQDPPRSSSRQRPLRPAPPAPPPPNPRPPPAPCRHLPNPALRERELAIDQGCPRRLAKPKKTPTWPLSPQPPQVLPRRPSSAPNASPTNRWSSAMPPRRPRGSRPEAVPSSSARFSALLCSMGRLSPIRYGWARAQRSKRGKKKRWKRR